MTDPTTEAFTPPAAQGLPAGTLEAAEIGANRLDAWARTPQGRNFLAHALVQLARTGWLRQEPGDGFEPMTDRPAAEPAPAVQAPATDRAALERVRRLHDALAEEGPLTSPNDEIPRGAAARKIAAALDGWTPPHATDRSSVLREAEEALRAQAKHLTGEFNDSDVLHEDGPAATVATWKRAADLLRRMAAEPAAVGRAADETGDAQPDVTVHAIPVPGSNGISSCCGRPPCEFIGERLTRDPAAVTCPGPAAGAQQPKEA